jgi:hypothetical protein
MKRIIAAGMITALLASADAVLAQIEEPDVQIFATAEEGGPAADGKITALLASADAVLAQTEESGVRLVATAEGRGNDGRGGSGVRGKPARPGGAAAPSRYDVSLLSEEMPDELQEWTGNNPKIVPGNWRGDGVIVAKICDDGDSMSDGLTETGDRVLIKAGIPAAFRPGDMLMSFIKGGQAYDTKTGRKLGVKLQKTGTLKVISVSGKKIIARILSAGTSVDKGQLITQ